MAEDESGQGPASSQDARLTSLDERLRRAERVEDERRPPVDALAGVRSTGARTIQSLVGMPAGGALIGWLIDRLVGTAPWVMLGLMFTGFAGAVLDMMRISKQRSDQDAGK
jgi:ATP synthase protein I